MTSHSLYFVEGSVGLTLTSFIKLKLLTESRNLGDQLLYDKMREKWLKSPEIRQDDFQNKVSKFNFKF